MDERQKMRGERGGLAITGSEGRTWEGRVQTTWRAGDRRARAPIAAANAPTSPERGLSVGVDWESIPGGGGQRVTDDDACCCGTSLGGQQSCRRSVRNLASPVTDTGDRGGMVAVRSNIRQGVDQMGSEATRGKCTTRRESDAGGGERHAVRGLAWAGRSINDLPRKGFARWEEKKPVAGLQTASDGRMACRAEMQLGGEDSLSGP
jgi:hypothetical protein